MPVAIPYSPRHTIGRVRDLKLRERHIICQNGRGPMLHLTQGNEEVRPFIDQRIEELAARAAAAGLHKRDSHGHYAGPKDGPPICTDGEADQEVSGPFAPVPQSPSQEAIASPGGDGAGADLRDES